MDRLEGLPRHPVLLPVRPGGSVHPEWDPPRPDCRDNEARQGHLRDLVGAMDAVEVDALVHPTWLSPPAHIGRAREEYAGDNSQRVAPATGMPATTVPMGFTEGVHPAGLKILARARAEGLLFGLAYAYERGTGHRRPPEGFGKLGR